MIELEAFALDPEKDSHKASKEEMKVEAMERMELLGISEDIIRDFKDNDKIYESDYPDGHCEELSSELSDDIKDIEEQSDLIVYHVVLFSNTEDPTDKEYNYLFVSHDTASWPKERAEIRKNRPFNVYLYPVGYPDCPEVGPAVFAKSIGPGIVRVM